MDNKRLTWAEINLAAIRYNLRSIKERTKANIMAVVKANAYGHGVEEICRVCIEEGVTYFGVATLEEALGIREAGFSLPILVLGYLPEEYAEIAIDNDISLTVFNETLPQALSRAAIKLGKKAVIHIKVDTGMGRLGFVPELGNIDKIAKIVKLPGINPEGIFTHFATADCTDKEFSFKQLEYFNYVVTELEKQGINFKIKHTANSAAVIDISEAHFDMVRAGIVLYGLYPSSEVTNLDIIPAMRLKVE